VTGGKHAETKFRVYWAHPRLASRVHGWPSRMADQPQGWPRSGYRTGLAHAADRIAEKPSRDRSIPIPDTCKKVCKYCLSLLPCRRACRGPGATVRSWLMVGRRCITCIDGLPHGPDGSVSTLARGWNPIDQQIGVKDQGAGVSPNGGYGVLGRMNVLGEAP